MSQRAAFTEALQKDMIPEMPGSRKANEGW